MSRGVYNFELHFQPTTPHQHRSKPPIMKTFLIVLLALVVVIVIGLMLLIRLGVSTTVHTLAECVDGNDRLKLEYRYTSDWGNSLISVVLLYNDKLVDFRGLLRGRENEGSKVFPVRAADLQQIQPRIVNEANAPVLEILERLHRRTGGLPTQTEAYPDIATIHPEIAHWTPWTVWVNPRDFSAEAYQRIHALLRKCGSELIAQQQKTQLPTNDGLPKLGWSSKEPLAIWRTVYFDYMQLKAEIFRRTTPEKEETIEISPGGFAGFRHKSAKYTAGYGCGLGALNDTGDTLLVSQAWKYSEETFPINELSAFRDATGRALTEVYRIVEAPDDPTEQQ